jgi:hypothetical protein
MRQDRVQRVIFEITDRKTLLERVTLDLAFCFASR